MMVSNNVFGMSLLDRNYCHFQRVSLSRGSSLRRCLLLHLFSGFSRIIQAVRYYFRKLSLYFLFIFTFVMDILISVKRNDLN